MGEREKTQVRVLHISGIVLPGPDQVILTLTVEADLDFRVLQEKFIDEDYDPLDPDKVELLMPILKDRLDLSPFRVDHVKLVSASQENLVVKVGVVLPLDNKIRDRETLLQEYEQLLRSKMRQLAN